MCPMAFRFISLGIPLRAEPVDAFVASNTAIVTVHYLPTFSTRRKDFISVTRRWRKDFISAARTWRKDFISVARRRRKDFISVARRWRKDVLTVAMTLFLARITWRTPIMCPMAFRFILVRIPF